MYRIRFEIPEVTKKKGVTNVRTKIVNAGNRDANILVRVQLLESNGQLASVSYTHLRVIEYVSLYQPSHLYLSLDGDRETYQRMRGRDGYDKDVYKRQVLMRRRQSKMAARLS